MGRFKNEPFTDFSDVRQRQRLETALVSVRQQWGRTYPLWIANRQIRTPHLTSSINPSYSQQVVGFCSDADRRLADRALQAATDAFPSWNALPVAKRAAHLFRWAKLLRARKFEFCAWLIYEVGKNWAEADADVAEAIDFLEYYAQQALETPPTLVPVSGERNHYIFQGLGPVVVIPPWNFPLAILVGMTAAALVTGNTVVLKPSGQSPVIAALFVSLTKETDLPAGVLNLVTGAGSTIGDYLVTDRRTRMVAFTGSKDVGLHINQLAARHQPRQQWIKRVIAEMGGKNAIVVDRSADLDAAARGVTASAFGYQGQKCSACSRVFIHKAVYREFVDRLLGQVSTLRIGPAEIYGHSMGPVISFSAQQGILSAMARAKREGRLLYGGGKANLTGGFYLMPTVVDRLPRSSRLWKEEIFGPVVALAPVGSLAEALERANETDFGLTGAVYARDKTVLDRVRREMFCGNLYLNRKSTGALVGGHPFGGFNLSGTDSKAGGPEYLALFRQAQCVSEKL
jgi:1-pyrroline-5-carboxylate dehydrogenase